MEAKDVLVEGFLTVASPFFALTLLFISVI